MLSQTVTFAGDDDQTLLIKPVKESEINVVDDPELSASLPENDNGTSLNNSSVATSNEQILESLNKSNLELINLPVNQEMKDQDGNVLDGRGIKIAILDTGCNRITDTIIDKFNFIDGTDNISDHMDHGTSVTDIIREVAPGASILVYKIMDSVREDGSIQNRVIQALKRAVAHGANIVNLSLGQDELIYNPWNAFIKEVEQIVKQGIVVVAGAGNNTRTWGVNSPGTSPFVISVGATTSDGERIAKYSNHGPIEETWEIKPDVAAPGRYKMGIDKSNKGTSYATPYVTALAALIKQKHREWTPHEIKSALVTTATILYEDGEMTSPTAQGSGRINVLKSLNTTTLFSPVHISFEPVSVNEVKKLGVSKQERCLKIRNSDSRSRVYCIGWDWHRIPNGLKGEISQQEIILQPGEEKEISLFLSTDSTAMSGFHSANLTISSETDQWHIPILAMVELVQYPILSNLRIYETDNSWYIQCQLPFLFTDIEIEIITPEEDCFNLSYLSNFQGTFQLNMKELTNNEVMNKGVYKINLRAETKPTSTDYRKYMIHSCSIEI